MSDFKKGMTTGIVLYIIAVICTLLAHYAIGWDASSQGPPASFMIAIFFACLGLYRLFKTAYLISRFKGQARNQGEMTIHLIIFGLLVLSFLYANFF